MEIVTWNIPYPFNIGTHSEAWEYFLDEISAGYYLAQEVRPPDWVVDEHEVIWAEKEDVSDSGSAIISRRHTLEELDIGTNFRGAFVVAESNYTSEFTLTLISMYGLFQTIGGVGYATPNLHRMLSDLTGLLDGRTHGNRSVVLGGDLNTSPQWDERSNRNTNRVLFERLEDFGLTNCFDLFFEDYIQTYRHSQGDYNWQNDYLFISNHIADNIRDCEVLVNEKIRKFSDHNPVLITLDIG